MNWVKISALILFCGVLAGAFGAHAMKERLSEYAMGIWSTATLYLFIHGLALFALSLSLRIHPELFQRVSLIQYCFLFGILLFSGSLYALALTDIKILGAVTPIGGVLFLVGWLLFLI